MTKLLQGKIALVTGATSGIGKSIAFLFAQEGATVIGVGTSQTKIEEATQAALELQLPLTYSKVDIANKEMVEALIKSIIEHYGKIDILVNNAGITRDGLLMKMSDDDWHKVIDVNLTSAFYTCRATIRHMIKAREGSIINVSSIVGLIGNAGQTNYAASKAGLIGFSKSLALEVASRKVRVNAIAPGFIETGMVEALGDAKKQQAADGIPMGRMGNPEEIAATALFLASSAASYITGQVLVVDGGLSLK